MRVRDCEGCCYCRRKVWVQYYEPKNFHPIGFTHAYAYCEKHKKRVSQVRSCDGPDKGGASI